MLILPAFNEEDTVAACIRRVPSWVRGHPVHCLVVDDGSGDSTAIRARDAGAEVVSLPSNRGLGAAIRTGLSLAIERGAAAVAFCDADAEYPPEELGNLVEPILAGEADYVVGSRFTGQIGRMRPHRRIGNMILTRLLSFIARRPITDGQSGYRAFSPLAAADAEIIHDFNYAQVITLDLLAKGYRYTEVPISYSFRTSGESFVHLGQYLCNVVPAVYSQLNRQPQPERRAESPHPENPAESPQPENPAESQGGTMQVNRRSRVLVALTAAVSLLAVSCASDDGADVRNLDSDSSESDSGSSSSPADSGSEPAG